MTLLFGFLSAILNVTESLEIKQVKSYRFNETAEGSMIAWLELWKFQNVFDALNLQTLNSEWVTCENNAWKMNFSTFQVSNVECLQIFDTIMLFNILKINYTRCTKRLTHNYAIIIHATKNNLLIRRTEKKIKQTRNLS